MAKTAKVKKVKEHNQETPSSKIFWAFMYLILIVVVLVAACFIYDRTYYTPFYVVGRSMAPTLNDIENVQGGYYEYGIVDEHRMAMRSLKRYDLVITYYNEDYEEQEETTLDVNSNNAFIPCYASNTILKKDSGAKIKRVIGLPNETVTIENKFSEEKREYNEISITKVVDNEPTTFALELPFTPLEPFGLARAVAEHNNTTKHDIGLSFSVTLGEDEYFVMGDNWGHSDDSTSLEVGPVKSNFIEGIVIRIEGKVKIEGSKVSERIEYDKKDIRYYKQ